jgi:hypothetical protein
MTVRWLVLLVVASGCASGGRGDATNGNGQHDASTGSSSDGPQASDGPPTTDGKPPTDAPTDAPIDSIPGSGLDPDLSLPDPGGQVCDEPGRSGLPECPAVDQVCRYFTATEGRCEPCSTCGNSGASCSATSQCDILYECYQGQCVSFCTLGSLACGAVADCINIGHATRGVCRP